MAVTLVRIPDQHQLPVAEHPDDETGVYRALMARSRSWTRFDK